MRELLAVARWSQREVLTPDPGASPTATTPGPTWSKARVFDSASQGRKDGLTARFSSSGDYANVIKALNKAGFNYANGDFHAEEIRESAQGPQAQDPADPVEFGQRLRRVGQRRRDDGAAPEGHDLHRRQ